MVEGSTALIRVVAACPPSYQPPRSCGCLCLHARAHLLGCRLETRSQYCEYPWCCWDRRPLSPKTPRSLLLSSRVVQMRFLFRLAGRHVFGLCGAPPLPLCPPHCGFGACPSRGQDACTSHCLAELLDFPFTKRLKASSLSFPPSNIANVIKYVPLAMSNSAL